LVVELNVFDGLSHNTSSIMRNLIQEEYQDTADPADDFMSTKADDEYTAVMNMMDAKEFNNPIDVYKEIAPTLIDSGDINKYKDWVTKLKTSPGYNTENVGKAKELFKIKFRKQSAKAIFKLRACHDIFGKLITKTESAETELYLPGSLDLDHMVFVPYYEAHRGVLSSIDEINYVADYVRSDLGDEDPLYKYIANIMKGLSTYRTHASKIGGDVDVELELENFKHRGYGQLINALTRYKQLVNTIILFVDSI
jgi:hypothetical protein